MAGRRNSLSETIDLLDFGEPDEPMERPPPRLVMVQIVFAPFRSINLFSHTLLKFAHIMNLDLGEYRLDEMTLLAPIHRHSYRWFQTETT